MKKKFISLISTIVIATMFTSTASAVKMYAPDGRTASVMESDVAAWKAKGWSTKNYKTMYAADGRTAKVLLTDVEAWKKVGWYDVPVTTVYAPDGRTQVIAKSNVSAWKKVGWYDVPVATVYAKDGRTQVIAKDDVDAWIDVGWYRTEYVKVWTTSVPVGSEFTREEKQIKVTEIDEWAKKGWYNYITFLVYNKSTGESKVIKQKDLFRYRDDGWTTTKPDENNSSSKNSAEYKACPFCNNGRQICSTCGGSGTVRRYSGVGWTWVNERCPAVDCVNGRCKCPNCGGRGTVRK